jgi:hypothetical protein
MVRARATAWADEKPALIDAGAYRLHVLSVDPEATFD